MHFDHAGYAAYIHSLLEPSDRLITGKYKRDQPLPPIEVNIELERFLKETDQEKNIVSDEYLKKFNL
jgi:hypothetical protein